MHSLYVSRRIYFRVFTAALLFSAVFVGEAACARFVLVKNRSPAAAFIVAPEQAGLISGCRTAAEMIEDFNDDLYECAGCRLPVLEADGGSGRLIRFRIEERPFADEDRFGISFPDSRTMLITGSTVSLRWSLNHILYEHAGARYPVYSKNGAHFPPIDDLTVPREEVSVSPSFNISRRITNSPCWDKRMGNHIASTWRVPNMEHLPLRVFPVQEYMRSGEWPDFIFPVIGGERYLPYKDASRGDSWRDYAHRWQPCLTDERVVDEAVRNITAYFENNPGAAGISMTMNDTGGFCECEGCSALLSGERTWTGHLDYSNLYYGWINRIAGRVFEKHPGRYFGVSTYRETLNPPDFELHPNIIVLLLYDAHQAVDEEVKARRLDFFGRWAEKASRLGIRVYYLHSRFDVPRAHFGLQQEVVRKAHDLGAELMYVGSSGGLMHGPEQYLYHRLAWDANLDLEKELRDWYEACVGEEAAPYLAEYYRMWEEIWAGPGLETSWFKQGKDKVYMGWTHDKSYLYAVGPDDLPRMRRLMERVVELAGRHGDSRQKIRAGWLMKDFRYSEACIYAMGGDKLPPSGVVETAGQALSYLEFLPEALRYDALREKIFNERVSDPDLGPGYSREMHFQPRYVPGVLARVAELASEPEVLEALISARDDKNLPNEVRGLVDVLVKIEKGEPVNNLMLDGSFEEGRPDWRAGRVTGARAYRGANSLQLNLRPPFIGILSRHGRNFPLAEIEPGPYYVSVMVYVDAEHHEPESYVRFRATAWRDGRGTAHFDRDHVHVVPGEWTRISLVANVPERANNFNLDRIHFFNFSSGDTAYIDDVIVAPLGR